MTAKKPKTVTCRACGKTEDRDVAIRDGWENEPLGWLCLGCIEQIGGG